MPAASRFRPGLLLSLALAALLLWMARGLVLPGGAEAPGRPSGAEEAERPAAVELGEGPAAGRRTEAGGGDEEEAARSGSGDPGEALAGGSILLPDGRPAARALVWTGDNPGVEGGRSTLAGADGSWSLRLAPGRHRLGARARGTGTARLEILIPGDASTFLVPDLRLPPGGRIRGTVHGGPGPLPPGLLVRAERSDGRLFRLDGAAGDPGWGLAEAPVDRESGAFLLEGLDPVPHDVRLLLTGMPLHRPEPEVYREVLPGGPPLEFRIVPRHPVRGVVRDGWTGEPVSSFDLNAFHFEDPEGRFEYPGNPAETALVFEAPSYEEQALPNPVREDGGPVEGLEILLVPKARTGSLVLAPKRPDGSAVAAFRVLGRAPDGAPWQAEAAEPGLLRVPRLQAGRHHLRLRAPGHADAVLEAEIPPGGEARAEPVLQPAGSVELRARNRHGRVPRMVQVRILAPDGEKGPAWSFRYRRLQGTIATSTEAHAEAGDPAPAVLLASADGFLEGLPPGRWRLEIHWQGGGRSLVPFEVPEQGAGLLEIRQEP